MATNIILNSTGKFAKVRTMKRVSTIPKLTRKSILLPQFLPWFFTGGNVLTQNVAVLSFIAKKAGRQDLLGGDD